MIYAQNGISLERLQEDPYFTSGSAFEPEDEKGKSTGLQMDNPDNPKTFYNSDNWSGGIKKDFENQEPLAPIQEEKETAEDENTEDKKTETEIFFEEGAFPLPTDAERGIAFNYKNTKLEFFAGWMISWAPSFIENTFASYFNQYAGVQPLGFSIKADWLFLGKESVKFGLGAYGSWSRISQEENHYEITADQFNVDLLLVFKVFTEEGFEIDIHAGGGFLFIGLVPEGMSLQYDNGLLSDGSWWCYPEARVGGCYEVFVYDHAGFVFSLDAAWPFMFENNYPRLEFTLGMAARF